MSIRSSWRSRSSIRSMDPEVKEAAERAASDDRRSLASLIEKLLTDYCLEHGYLKPERAKRRRRR